MEVARKLQTVTSQDDVTCPGPARKTYGGAAGRVWSKDDMALTSRDFVGPQIQKEGPKATSTNDDRLICQVG